MSGPGERSLWGIFRLPLYIGLLSALGLIAALLTDGPWDVVWASAVAVPVVVVAARFVLVRRRR